MLAVAFMMAISANAQIATENAKIFDNTYVGVEGGVSTPLNFNSVFPVNPIAGIKVGKELTPVFGLEAEGLVTFGDNIYRYGVTNMGSYTKGVVPFNIHGKDCIKTFVKATNVGLNGVINWSNLLFGYQGTPRFFEVKSNTGLGWVHYFGGYPSYTINETDGTTINIGANRKNVLSAKTAIDFVFNLGTKKAHTVMVSPGVYWSLNETGKVQFNKNYAQFGVMVGYAYHFKTSNRTHAFKTYDVGAMREDIDRLNKELTKKPKEVVVEKIVEKIVTNDSIVKTNITDTYVFFDINSAELDSRAKEQLNKLGENGIYVVDAYASSEGTTEYNKALSQRRADAVKTYLEGRGCKVDSAVGHGVQFGTTTGRVAVVTNK